MRKVVERFYAGAFGTNAQYVLAAAAAAAAAVFVLLRFRDGK
jgi:hypothetical protein